VQLVGTVFFNFNTADAMIPGLSWREEDLFIWTPNMLGSACFLVASYLVASYLVASYLVASYLVASYLAYADVSHGAASLAPRSISWWIAIINLAGSVAFQISAVDSVVGPAAASPAMLFWSTLLTAVGAVCFLVGAYLLIPELFDTD
jgi:hypothetical protein